MKTDKTFKVYTRPTCHYCQLAINLLRDSGADFTARSIDGCPGILREVRRSHNWETVPIIFETSGGRDKFIGGFSDLQEYLSSGKQLLRG